MRVLCGSHSQITCALKLHVDYPTVCNVSLQSATGLPVDFNLDSIQVMNLISFDECCTCCNSGQLSVLLVKSQLMPDFLYIMWGCPGSIKVNTVF